MRNNLEVLLVAVMVSLFFIITDLMVKALGSVLSLVIIIGLIILVAIKLRGGDKNGE